METGGDAPAFKFVPPSASMKSIAEYLEVGGEAMQQVLNTAEQELDSQMQKQKNTDSEGEHS